MTPAQALAILDQVVSKLTATREVHAQISEALQTLENAIFVKPSK